MSIFFSFRFTFTTFIYAALLFTFMFYTLSNPAAFATSSPSVWLPGFIPRSGGTQIIKKELKNCGEPHANNNVGLPHATRKRYDASHTCLSVPGQIV